MIGRIAEGVPKWLVSLLFAVVTFVAFCALVLFFFKAWPWSVIVLFIGVAWGAWHAALWT